VKTILKERAQRLAAWLFSLNPNAAL